MKGKLEKRRPNTLDRKFMASKPNQKWVTDVTEFKIAGQKLYLSAMLDLFNREIITYTLHTKPSFDLVETMLLQGVQRLREGDDLLLHSDQGWHYRMPKYRRILKDHHITQSMSRKGNCYDNAVMENFFGIMKSEFLYRETFRNLKEFNRKLEEYMDYYNHLRIKSTLGKKSPVEYRLYTQRMNQKVGVQ
ncbi:IS3 family transposase [Rossellomorea marisflavi]|uniref:IS3 family transposase n=3 Tax=Rossellomorea TaxID=2837508 RepID=UPI003D26D56A